MTGNARCDAARDVDAGTLAGALVGALDALGATLVEGLAGRPANGPGLLADGPRPDHAGSLVATATSRGAKPATVAPGRALGKRRTTAAAGVAELAAELAAEVAADRGPVALARLAVAAAAACAAAGATERIALPDAGRTVAVLKSSCALAAARSSAGPRGAATLAGSPPGTVRARPPIEASASPPDGRYAGGSTGRACDVVAMAGVAVPVAAGRIVRAGAVVVARAAARSGGAGAVAGVAGCGTLAAGGVVVAAATGADCVVVAAGILRTTGSAAVRAGRLAAAAAPADGAGSNDRRAVAAATVSAGPVARRSPAGVAVASPLRTAPDLAAAGVAGSTADISESTDAMPRAAVSPGAECPAVTVAGGTTPTSAVPGPGAAVAAGAADFVGTEGISAGSGAAAGAAPGAIERRTTGAGGGAAAEVAVAPGTARDVAPRDDVARVEVVVVGACAAAACAAAAARERGVAAWRNAAHRPTGGLAAAMVAAPAAAIGPDAGVGAVGVGHAVPAPACCVDALPATAALGATAAELPDERCAAAAAGMRRTTLAEKSAVLALCAASAGRGPASPARFPGARSPGERFDGPRCAAVVRSRSTSIGPIDVTSGGRRTRTTSAPIRSAMCPGRGPSARPARTTRGNPRGGTGGAGVAAVETASSWLCADHQYCHQRGGCTPWPALRVRIGSGPRSDRRTSGECAVAAANRVAAIATLPIGDGRGRVSGGPGRRNRRATSWPRLASPPSVICSRTRDARPRALLR